MKHINKMKQVFTLVCLLGMVGAGNLNVLMLGGDKFEMQATDFQRMVDDGQKVSDLIRILKNDLNIGPDCILDLFMGTEKLGLQTPLECLREVGNVTAVIIPGIRLEIGRDIEPNAYRPYHYREKLAVAFEVFLSKLTKEERFLLSSGNPHRISGDFEASGMKFEIIDFGYSQDVTRREKGELVKKLVRSSIIVTQGGQVIAREDKTDPDFKVFKFEFDSGNVPKPLSMPQYNPAGIELKPGAIGLDHGGSFYIALNLVGERVQVAIIGNGGIKEVTHIEKGSMCNFILTHEHVAKSGISSNYFKDKIIELPALPMEDEASCSKLKELSLIRGSPLALLLWSDKIETRM